MPSLAISSNFLDSRLEINTQLNQQALKALRGMESYFAWSVKALEAACVSGLIYLELQSRNDSHLLLHHPSLQIFPFKHPNIKLSRCWGV